MKRTVFAGLLLFSLAHAQEKVSPANVDPFARQEGEEVDTTYYMIQTQFECVETSHEDATRLLFLRDQSSFDASKLRGELQKMVVDQKAKVVDTILVVSGQGQKVTSESHQELIYATEYEPPGIPNQVDIPDKKITPEMIKVMEWMRVPATPTAFEPRNVGGSLEVETTMNLDATIVDLRYTWEIVDHEGEKVWQEQKDTSGNVSKIAMPLFYVKRLSGNMTASPGQHHLVALIDPQDAKGRRDPSKKWFVFCKCEVQKGK
jgi:hypothetical protein